MIDEALDEKMGSAGDKKGSKKMKKTRKVNMIDEALEDREE